MTFAVVVLKNHSCMSEEQTAAQLHTEFGESQELALIVPIRNETVFSQFPLHRLSKGKESLSLQITTSNEKGKVITAWKVVPSAEYGEPGILAYKLDTLFINRLIDEARPDIPEVIKLGSLKDICREFGVSESGKSTNDIKRALYQNATANIRADLSYTSNDGRNRSIKFVSSRYAVVLTGETLPNGREADAVYIVLAPLFREILRTAKTRPLDYSYLKGLPPTAQRLYELISPKIFAALKFDNPRAKYLYSELCKYAPLTRYQTWEQVKKQLYKVHHPHKTRAYFSKVEYEETTDENGVIDWIIWYTPGRKAKAEYRAFNTKEGKLGLKRERAPRPHQVTASIIGAAINATSWHDDDQEPENQKTRKPEIKKEPSPQDAILIEKLTSFGIDENRAARLIEEHREESEIWANAWPHQNQKGMDNPPAVLIRFIETKRRPLPKGYKEGKEREEKQKQHESQEAKLRAEEDYFRFFESEFRAFQRKELAKIEKKKASAFLFFKEWLDKTHAKGLRMVTNEKRRDEITMAKAEEFFSHLHPELKISFIGFDEWDKKHNAQRCDPVENHPRIFQVLYERLST